MAKSMITILTTLSMMFHALLGCCYHHAHEDVVSHGEQKLESEFSKSCIDSHATVCNSHKHSDSTASNFSHDNSENHEHDHLPCEESPCTYVSSAHTELIALALVIPLDVESMVTPINVSAKDFESRRNIPVNSKSTCMRLRKQVWLI
tara:strand:- start:1759 stop:2202 length:444 start_codon:yes stop_codon:yes gene_type:complete